MARGPQAIGEVLSELMARRGFARVQGAGALEEVWKQAAGPWLAAHTRLGQLRRGTLDVMVANSTLVQELGFQKQTLLKKLRELLPDGGIENLRFRSGNIR